MNKFFAGNIFVFLIHIIPISVHSINKFMSFRKFRPMLSVILCWALITCNFAAFAQTRRQTATPSARKIKLVLGIVIDQFRYDYLARFEDQFGEGGFKRLLQGGANFTNANYMHTPTVTACGHAIFMSGSLPNENGVIGNEWYDRDSGKKVTSVSDDKTKLLGGKDTTGSSPHRLLVSTLGDQLKIHTNGQAKVIGVSLKDRAAILPAGKKPNGAFWYDDTTGKIVSSTYYFPDLPDWVKAFNNSSAADKYYGQKWEKLLPEAAYARSLPDNSPYEKWIYGTTFPHVMDGGPGKTKLGFYKQFEGSPFANEMIGNLAKAAIENEDLGKDDVTDLLTVSFSANDIVGHYHGPHSPEAQDMTLRTDRILADLFSYIDKKIGLQNVVVVLTADHGGAPVPEHAQTFGIGGRIEGKDITDAVNTALSQRFGKDQYVLQLLSYNIYFDYAALEKHQASRVEAERIAAEAIRKNIGVAECFTRTDILNGQLPRTHIANSVSLGFHSVRNGDAVFVVKPFWIVSELNLATTHATPYHYDTHVPIIFYGAGINAGSFTTGASPNDIAPTLASILNIEAPSNSIGQILNEAIKK